MLFEVECYRLINLEDIEAAWIYGLKYLRYLTSEALTKLLQYPYSLENTTSFQRQV